MGGKDTFAGVGMGGGKAKLWFLFGLGIILFAGLQTLLSWLFKMGKPVDLSALFAQVASTGMTPPIFMVVLTTTNTDLGTIFRAADHIWRRIRLAGLFTARINETGACARGGSAWRHLGYLALAGYLDGL